MKVIALAGVSIITMEVIIWVEYGFAGILMKKLQLYYFVTR